MSLHGSARRAAVRIPTIQVAGVLIALAAIATGVDHRAAISSSLAGAPPGAALVGEHLGLDPAGNRALGQADGAVPEGTTVFDVGVPAVGNLDPGLLGALQRAATAADAAGVTILVESGWRSAAYQEELLREAVARYGSAEEAARWVASPTTSAHVSGDAVDVGSSDAIGWLAAHGARLGLCQVYRNEPWHFELRPEAIGGHCPRMYADASRDPRTSG